MHRLGRTRIGNHDREIAQRNRATGRGVHLRDGVAHRLQARSCGGSLENLDRLADQIRHGVRAGRWSIGFRPEDGRLFDLGVVRGGQLVIRDGAKELVNQRVLDHPGEIGVVQAGEVLIRAVLVTQQPLVRVRVRGLGGAIGDGQCAGVLDGERREVGVAHDHPGTGGIPVEERAARMKLGRHDV